MIGFVTTQSQAQQVNNLVADEQTKRGFPVFWLPGMFLIHHGIYSGLYFIPCDEQILTTPLYGNPPLTPPDFPEFQTIIKELGGLDARVNISPSDIIE